MGWPVVRGQAMDKKFQVFISSTFEDLKEERRAVTEMILNLGHIPVGMELFQASDESQWTHIQRRIEDCDYYLVIVAERYGSEVKGKSYTQMEYEYAVKTGVPVAAFLLDSSERANWPQGRTEPEKRAKVEAFRALCGKKLCKFWKTPEDLAAKVASSLPELIRVAPRKGWVRADQLPSAAVTDELARLSEENRGLRERVEAFERQAGGVQVPPEIMAKMKYAENNFGFPFSHDQMRVNAMDLFILIDNVFYGKFSINSFHEFLHKNGISNKDVRQYVISEYKRLGLVNNLNDGIYYVLTKFGADIIMYYRLLQAEKQQQAALQP